jgi:hypothetical protein
MEHEPGRLARLAGSATYKVNCRQYGNIFPLLTFILEGERNRCIVASW